jgi:hypothetical protein
VGTNLLFCLFVLVMGYTLVRSVGVFGPFELDFESFHTNLEAIHGLNSSLSTGWVVETDKTCNDCL